MDNYIDIVNFDWESAEIGICHCGFGPVRAEIDDGSRKLEICTEESGSIFRLAVSGLKADCAHEATVYYPEGRQVLHFRTLPAPTGKLSGFYAVIADPHLSIKKENRKGRLFIEAAAILTEILTKCNALGVDFILIAGDLTNSADPDEFALADRILSTASRPVICAPGDHDIMGGYARWMNSIASRHTSGYSNALFNVKAINTAENLLTPGDAERLASMLNDPRIPLILTHVHLLPNPELKYGSKAGGIRNAADYRELLERFRQRNSIIYAGHQNIPSLIADGNLRQVHLPQPCQFPCAWYHVRVFDNGLYHKSMPIASEILRQQSRIDSEQAAGLYGEPQWRSEYRRGTSPANGNFVLPLPDFQTNSKG